MYGPWEYNPDDGYYTRRVYSNPDGHGEDKLFSRMNYVFSRVFVGMLVLLVITWVSWLVKLLVGGLS